MRQQMFNKNKVFFNKPGDVFGLQWFESVKKKKYKFILMTPLIGIIPNTFIKNNNIHLETELFTFDK